MIGQDWPCDVISERLVVITLVFKTSLLAKPYESVYICMFCMKTRFETEAHDNLEVAYKQGVRNELCFSISRLQ